jgi:hypothetical protein
MSSATVRVLLGAIMLAGSMVSAQGPSPFPRPSQQPSRPAPSSPSPSPSTPAPSTPNAAEGEKGAPGDLGVPIYPGAQFITSYDAGRGQRYYLYGTEADFNQIVAYYRTTLKQKGELIFEEPPVHMFDIGRYKR